MPLAIVSAVIQGLLIFHVVKTGRDSRWIFLILFLPGIGPLIYIVMEIMPSLGGGLAARRAARKVTDMVDPGRGLRQQTLEHERSQSVDTSTRLARELIKDGKFDAAIKVCEEARSGIFEDDPTILLTLANAFYSKDEYAEAIKTLDLLREKNPEFRSPDGHLLYARSLEADGATDLALKEYESVAGYFPGAEARVRLAQLHKQLGNADTAITMFRDITQDARLAPKHFQKAQKEWLDIAKREGNL